MLKRRVCRIEEVSEEPQEFSLEGITMPVLVFAHGDEIVAGAAMCPHEDVSLASGCVEDDTIVCSAHGYAFSLRDGKATHDPSLCWKRYRTTILGGDLYVDLA